MPLDQPNDDSMSFGDHLEELRRRILWALAAPVPLSIAIFTFRNTLIGWLLLPLYKALRQHGLPTSVQQLGLAEAIVIQIKLSLIGALVLSAPWILWQAWKFIAPGLYQHEKRFVRFLLPGSAIMTIASVTLTYFGMLPLMVYVLIAVGASIGVDAPTVDMDPRVKAVLEQNPPMQLFETPPTNPTAGQVWIQWPEMKRCVAIAGPDGAVEVVDAPQAGRGTVAQNFRLSEYINFVLMLLLGTAIAFQMPLVVVLLGWLGLASAQWLRDRRKYALFICGVVAAVITPTADILSMLIMMVPLYGLYELGILLLVLAPASAVAEGRVLSLRRFARRKADNRREPMDRRPAPAQSDQIVARGELENQRAEKPTDGGQDNP